VLLIEDEPKMASLLRGGLRDEGLFVDVTTNGHEGVWAATENEYDAIVLDVMLPDISGFDVCRRLRAAGVWAPILVLTARSAVAELLARLRALLRRGPVVPGVLVVGDLRLDPGARRVWRGDCEVALTGQEFSLLHTLARRAGRVLTREQLLHLAWDVAYEHHSNVVDVCVKGLRDRVDRPFQRHSIQTVRGVGYRLNKDSQ
jgi:two-component system OmpR family response regulator